MFGLCRKPKQFDRVIDRNPYIIDALEKLGFKEITLESQFVENRITNSFYKPMSPKNYARILTDEQHYNFIRVLACALDEQRRGEYGD